MGLVTLERVTETIATPLILRVPVGRFCVAVQRLSSYLGAKMFLAAALDSAKGHGRLL